jgi:hypothetical protein
MPIFNTKAIVRAGIWLTTLIAGLSMGAYFMTSIVIFPGDITVDGFVHQSFVPFIPTLILGAIIGVMASSLAGIVADLLTGGPTLRLED